VEPEEDDCNEEVLVPVGKRIIEGLHER